MRQIRKISNLVAEELQGVMESKGIQMDENAFEAKVSEIVKAISESVEGIANEEVTVDDLFMATTDTQLVGADTAYDIEAGYYVSVDGYTDEDVIEVSIYDTDGEELETGIEVVASTLEDLLNAETLVPVDDEVGESAVNELKRQSSAQKKVLAKREAKFGKKRDAHKEKEGFVRMMKDGKFLGYRKMTSKEKASKKANGKKLGKKSGSLREGAVTKTVAEGFDVNVGGMKIALECGDVMTVAEGIMTVVRDGKTIVTDVAVDEAFMSTCIAEGVVADSTIDEGADVAILSYKADKGYVLVREGAEFTMGNRVRARACLRDKGFNVTSDMLDKASNGELVTL